MPAIDYRAAKRVALMSDVLDLLGWKQTAGRGRTRKGPCPIHSSAYSQSDIFSVTGQVWFCHICQLGGSSLDLYARVTKLPLYDATRELLKRLGHPVPYLPRGERTSTVRPPRNREEEP